MVTATKEAILGDSPESDLESATAKCLKDLGTVQKISSAGLVNIVDRNQAACEELAASAADWRLRVRQLTKQARKEFGGSDWPTFVEDGASAQAIFSDLMDSLNWLATGEEEIFPNASWRPEALAPPVAFSLPRPLSSQADRGQQIAAKSMLDLAASSISDAVAPLQFSAQQGQPSQPHRCFGGETGKPRLEGRLDLDEALEELREGPRRTACNCMRLLKELEEMRHRFNKLRSWWPKLRKSISICYKEGKPIQIKELKMTLKEAVAWRGCMDILLNNANIICHRTEDFLQRCKDERDEKKQWKAKCEAVLCDLDRPLAARIAALTWCRRARAVITWKHDELDDLKECTAKTFARNLEAAELAARHLVKCAAIVMRLESDHETVQSAVGRLSSLKTCLLETSDAALAASDTLLESNRSIGANLTLLAHAIETLSSLLKAIDEAAETLNNCPLDLKKLEAVVSPENLSIKSVQAFCEWVRNSLVEEEDAEDEEFE
jgi:hypothetical protein